MSSGTFEVAQKWPTLLQRTRDALICWWVLIRSKLIHQGRLSPQATNCLELKKGTRFRLAGGEVQVMGEGKARPVAVKQSSSQPAYAKASAYAKATADRTAGPPKRSGN